MTFRALLVEKNDATAVQLFRSIFSSAFAFSVDFSLLAFFVEIVHLYYLLSALIGFMVGTTITYVLSVLWIFPRRSFTSREIEYGLFVVIGLVGLALNEGIMWLCTDVLSIFYLLSKVISGCTVFFWNFFARRRLLFR